MTTLELTMMILLAIGTLVYCGGLILIKEDSYLKFWWLEIGLCIYLLYVVICMIICLAASGPNDTHTNYQRKNDPIYVFPTYSY